ncbi:MAG: hypothetical protein HKN03_01100 [Acidimicrobiales bacterium]|nr:hypothetical protein [Acidimicrobiales bacterium]
MAEFAMILADTNSGWDHMDGWGGGWMWLWGVSMMVLFTILIVWMFRSAYRPPVPPTRDPTDRAKQILAERYASGDLSTEEYRERVAELQ